MHPAFSVVFFTTLSGAGYGLWFWLALSLLRSPGGHAAHLTGLALGFVLVSIGLLSSTLHLGQPQRAWRAFSQWRSSWLSREGVLAIAIFLPVLALAALLQLDSPLLKTTGPILTALVMLLAVATVHCTAMIYASLRTIPAWSHWLVPAIYLGFALHVGGLLAAALLSPAGEPGSAAALPVLASAFYLWRMKKRYWQDIDRGELPATRASALGLTVAHKVRVFEHPHTEANYLTREMGFVVARKHSRKLRVIAAALFSAIPALCALPVWLIPHLDAAPWFWIAALAALLGSLVERWLFFAQARHIVMLYY